jgi:hypothetical protein
MVGQTNPAIRRHQMTAKLRTTVLTLVAAFSFAVAVVPAAQAEQNTGSGGEERDNCYELAMAILRNRDAYYAEKKKDPNSFETKEAFHIWGESIDNYERECVKESATPVLPTRVVGKIGQQILQAEQIARVHSSTRTAPSGSIS